MVGIYSVLAYIVRQRRVEIGVRLALGATSAHIVGDVLRRALVLTIAGIAIGSVAAWWLARVLTGLFVGAVSSSEAPEPFGMPASHGSHE